MMNLVRDLGKYVLLMRRVFTKPDRVNFFIRQVFTEFQRLGLDSLGIVMII
jgi:phospholipid/cholesterol/gamma-HCH transport system permease protein